MTELTNSVDLDVTQAADDKPKNKTGGWGAGSIFLMISLLLASAVIGVALVDRNNQVQPHEGPAPTFDFTTFDGESHNLADFQGQVVVINFWASWCGPCRAEAPQLQSAWEKYEPTGDVVFLGIAYADNGPRSMDFMDEFGFTFLNAPDLGTRISEAYNIQGVPETFIINKNGEVAQFIYAGVTEMQLSQIIDGLLAEGA